MYNKDSAIGNKDNNFNLIRLILSIGVVCSHAFDLFPPSISYTFAKLTQVGSLGECCVFQFFGISGFLIFQSFLRNKSFLEFLIKRFLRLWPGLFVCISLTTVILGPLVTQMSIKEYFQDKQTLEYWLGNISLLTVRYHLPGVFEENYYKEAVNGSIWSLRIEFACYLMLLFSNYFVYRWLSRLEKYNKLIPKIPNLVIITLLFIYILTCIYLWHDIPKVILLIELKFFFIIGMIFHLLRKKIKFNLFILVFLIINWICFKHTFCNRIMYYLLIFYLLYCFAFSKSVRRAVKLDSDICYGTYIYGFPIQQLLYFYFPNLTSLSSLIFTIPIVLALACLSWYIVEKPCIKLIMKFRLIFPSLIKL